MLSELVARVDVGLVAHSAFTMVSGLAVGVVLSKRINGVGRILVIATGWLVAVILHGSLNFVSYLGTNTQETIVAWLFPLIFLGLLVACWWGSYRALLRGVWSLNQAEVVDGLSVTVLTRIRARWWERGNHKGDERKAFNWWVRRSVGLGMELGYLRREMKLSAEDVLLEDWLSEDSAAELSWFKNLNEPIEELEA
jgi:hypothetical protein